MWCLPAICRSYSERETMGFPRCRISLPQGRSYYLMWLYYIMIVSFNSIICISYGYMICIYDKFPKKNTKISILCVFLWFVHLANKKVPVISPHLLPPLGATACHDCRVQGCRGPPMEIHHPWGVEMGKIIEDTLWLCQNSYGKWWFIVDFPIENGDFP